MKADENGIRSFSTDVIFNKEEFFRRNNGDLDIALGLVTIFIESSPKYILPICTSLSEGSAVALCKSAHKLKGAAAVLSLPLLTETARRIESMAEAGDIEKAGHLLPELEQQCAQAVKVFQELLISLQGVSCSRL